MSRVQHKLEKPQQVPLGVGLAAAEAPAQQQIAKVSSRTSVQSSGESNHTAMCGMIKVYNDRTWMKFIFGIGPEHHPSQFPASRSNIVQSA